MMIVLLLQKNMSHNKEIHLFWKLLSLVLKIQEIGSKLKENNCLMSLSLTKIK